MSTLERDRLLANSSLLFSTHHVQVLEHDHLSFYRSVYTIFILHVLHPICSMLITHALSA